MYNIDTYIYIIYIHTHIHTYIHLNLEEKNVKQPTNQTGSRLLTLVTLNMLPNLLPTS